jgi:hypothetical protein
MSEETQKPEEGAEEAAPQQEKQVSEDTANDSTPESEETEAPTDEISETNSVEEEVVVAEILTERPALTEPGDFDWNSFEQDADDYSADDRKKIGRRVRKLFKTNSREGSR